MAIIASDAATREENARNFLGNVGIAANAILDVTDVTLTGATALGAVTPTELTIASGAITRTQQNHTVDTQSDAASDDLDTVTGAATSGVVTILRPVHADRTVVVRHGQGNILCPDGRNIVLAETQDYVILAGNGTAAVVVAASTLLSSPQTIADPGDAGAIPVTRSGVCPLESAGAETRTLAIPTFIGQRLVLVDDTHVGNIVVTVASPVNVANNNTLTFDAVSECIELVGVSVGGTRCWQVGFNDGVTLSTV